MMERSSRTYLVCQNMLLLGLPLIPVVYYFGNVASLPPLLSLHYYATFSGGASLTWLSSVVYQNTHSITIRAVLDVLGLLLRIVLFNSAFLWVVQRSRYLRSSILLNLILCLWSLAVGVLVYAMLA